MPGSTLTYTGTGGDLNVATMDDSGTVAIGVTAFTIPVSDLYIADPGDSVTVALMGLQYPWAGDLQVTLSLEDSSNHVLAGGDVFNRIGKTSADPSDPGYGTQFGNSFDSGDYFFNSGFPGDLWATAAPLGYTDSIPSGFYLPTTAFSSTSDGLSQLFGGLPVNGNWVLTIYDDYPPNSSVNYTPGITSWGLTIEATAMADAPEPSAAVLLLIAGSLWCLIRRIRALS